MKIVKGQYVPISSKYSEGLRQMVVQLLLKDYRKRPGIAEILKMDSMKQRMQMYGYKEDDHLLSSSSAGNFKMAAKSQEPKLVDLEKLKRELGQKNQKFVNAKPVADVQPVKKSAPLDPQKYKQLLRMPSPKREKSPDTKPKPAFINNALKNIM